MGGFTLWTLNRPVLAVLLGVLPSQRTFFSPFFFFLPPLFLLCQREHSVCKEAQAARPEPLQINLSVKARYAAEHKMHLTFSDIIAFGTLVYLKQH